MGLMSLFLDVICGAFFCDGSGGDEGASSSGLSSADLVVPAVVC